MLLFTIGLLPWICLCFRQGRAEETGTSKVEREKEREGERKEQKKEGEGEFKGKERYKEC